MATAFCVVTARAGQTAAVFALLPELLQAPALPTHFLVAHATGEPSRLLGAAAFVPVVQPTRTPGFRGQCRVLPAFRRQGVGRALVSRLAADVAAWDVPHLLSWQAEGEGPARSFLRAMGFRINYGISHFLGERDSITAYCAPRRQALEARGRIPAAMQLLPLADVPTEAVVALHGLAFNADAPAARAALAQALADPMVRRLSLALWDGEHLAGYLWAGPVADNTSEVRFWASDPRHRSGWPALLLLDGFVTRGSALGITHARFSVNDGDLAPGNIARRIGAPLVSVTQGYVLELPASALADAGGTT